MTPVYHQVCVDVSSRAAQERRWRPERSRALPLLFSHVLVSNKSMLTATCSTAA